nr:F-box/LRR-repeat protein At4g14096-like isoform X1 [Arachis hypogaea]
MCLKMGKRRKQRKAAVDRDVISRLPDEILCNILSFLPTRTSVATSVLSHRWRYLWKKVHVLDLNDDFLYTPERSHEEAQERFLIFLNKFELLRRLIRKFHLSCRVGDYGYDDLFHWIDYVIGRVSELHFSMRTDGESHDLHEAFYSTSLVSLVLDGNIIIFLEDFDPIHSESIFPSLKNLELHVNYVDLNVLLSGCPALETLRVTLINFDPEAIHMPRPLKSFNL